MNYEPFLIDNLDDIFAIYISREDALSKKIFDDNKSPDEVLSMLLSEHMAREIDKLILSELRQMVHMSNSSVRRVRDEIHVDITLIPRHHIQHIETQFSISPDGCKFDE